jgi:hypothetical protein
MTWHCYATAYSSGGSSARDDCLRAQTLLDWLVFQFSRYSLHADPQWIPLPAIPLMLHDITTGVDPQRTPFPAALPLVTLRGMTYSTLASLFIVPLPSDGCLFSLNYSGFQQTCHNIYSAFFFNHNELYCHVLGVCETNSNGFWFRWLDLLALLLQFQSIIRAHNQWLSKTHSIPYWTKSVFASAVTDLVPIYESVTSSASIVCWTLNYWTAFWILLWLNVNCLFVSVETFVDSTDMENAFHTKSISTNPHLHTNVC